MRTIARHNIEKMKIRQDRLVICGAGHVALAVIRLGKLLGFTITVIEDRPLFANQARAVLCDRTDSEDIVYCEAFDKALSREAGSLQTYFVIVTRGHRYDLDCLRSILKKPYAYVGMMGSKGRSLRVRELLLEEGFAKETIDTLHSPIGLSIGAKTPEEIAVSILSEIIQIRSMQQETTAAVSFDTEKEELPCPMELTKEVHEALLREHDKRVLLAVITDRKGSAPRTVGTTMAVFQDGRIVGTIGGGCMEAEVVREALLRMNAKTAQSEQTAEELPDILELRMLPEEAETEGMVCGGIIQVELLEVVNE